MNAIYKDMDSFALLRIAFYEVVRLNKTFAENFVNFNRMDAADRLRQSPQVLVNGLFGKHDISLVQRLSCGMPDFNDGFPKSRICVGAKETDSFEASALSSTQPLW